MDGAHGRTAHHRSIQRQRSRPPDHHAPDAGGDRAGRPSRSDARLGTRALPESKPGFGLARYARVDSRPGRNIRLPPPRHTPRHRRGPYLPPAAAHRRRHPGMVSYFAFRASGKASRRPRSRSRNRPAGEAQGLNAALSYAAIPAILQSTAHSLLLTGHTESRDWRSSEKPASSGTPFISASETGCLTGTTGAISTMTNLPLGSPGSG